MWWSKSKLTVGGLLGGNNGKKWQKKRLPGTKKNQGSPGFVREYWTEWGVCKELRASTYKKKHGSDESIVR